MVPLLRSPAVASALADVREGLAPDFYDPNAQPAICSDCGRVFLRFKRNRITYCPQCGADRQRTAHESMRLRTGPVYEKAVRKQLAYWTAEAKRLGLQLPDDAV